MAHRKKNRNVGVIGVGQTKHSSHREDVNQPEMVHEAVREALDDAGLTISDIDCIVHGNMELFEMIHQPDLWHCLGTGAYGKDSFRLTTGGTTGATLFCAGDNLVASGMYDVAMVIGFEKLQEGHTTGGITNMADPLWFRSLQTGALTGTCAYDLIQEFGEERANKVAMMYRIIMDQHASLNPKAHRAFGLEWDQMDHLIETSTKLIGDLKIIDMCSQSDGACAVIMASEDIAEKICPNPDWIWGTATRHSYTYFGDADYGRLTSMERCAKELFKKAGIKEPRKEIDVIELYQPYSFAGLIWIEDMGIVGRGKAPGYVWDGNTDMGGELPINPSGGVIACNPIGATGLIRCAEAAMQVMGKAEPRQVPDVNFAVSTGFGGCWWTDMLLHGKKKPN